MAQPSVVRGGREHEHVYFVRARLPERPAPGEVPLGTPEAAGSPSSSGVTALALPTGKVIFPVSVLQSPEINPGGGWPASCANQGK